MTKLSTTVPATFDFAGICFPCSRPHAFGLVLEPPQGGAASGSTSGDYLHEVLLAPAHREAFFAVVAEEGLVVCRGVHTHAPTYRRVRGKSSAVKLSQAEYYHHDGCSSPTKPRIVEIRCPHQDVTRNIATAVAPLPAVIHAMLAALPESLLLDAELNRLRDSFTGPKANHPPPSEWDSIQGKVTRLARRQLDAEGCREYFRHVDTLAGAYVLPWQMGESRLMLNSHPDLTRTMQHRRAYQKPRSETTEQNGSLVKRWPAEELDASTTSGGPFATCGIDD